MGRQITILHLRGQSSPRFLYATPQWLPREDSNLYRTQGNNLPAYQLAYRGTESGGSGGIRTHELSG